MKEHAPASFWHLLQTLVVPNKHKQEQNVNHFCIFIRAMQGNMTTSLRLFFACPMLKPNRPAAVPTTNLSTFPNVLAGALLDVLGSSSVTAPTVGTQHTKKIRKINGYKAAGGRGAA
jgi:hypothetical protein